MPRKRSKEEDRRREVEVDGFFFVCIKGIKEPHFYSEKVAVERLKKRQNTRQKIRQVTKKLKLKIRGRRITRNTIINEGENCGRRNPLCKIIKRIARPGWAGSGGRARMVSQCALIPFKTCLDLIQLGQGGVKV